MRATLSALVVVAAVSSWACAGAVPAEPAGPTAEDRAAVDAIASKYEGGYNAADAAAMAQLVTEDYESIQPDGTHIQGRAAFQEGLAARFTAAQAAGLTVNLTITPGYQTWIDATHVVAGGTFTVTGVAPGQPTSVSYVVAVRKGADGTWLITNNLAAPFVPPAAPAE
jgi:uncharacterized protein (TIGR02246 family)